MLDTIPAKDNDTRDEHPLFLGPSFGGGIPDDTELTAITEKATNLEAAFNGLIASHAESLAAKRESLDERVRQATATLQADGAAKAIVTKAAAQQADTEYNEHCRTVRELTQQDRDDMLRQFDELNKRASLTLKLFPTPIQMLAVAGLGSEERTKFHNQVAHAGSAELSTLASYAYATGNTILASALLARLDQLPKSMPKPFRAGALAEAVVGEKHKAQTKAAKTVAAAFQRFVNQNRAFERGKVSSFANLSDALSRHELAKE